jgi:hypothetical protein
MSDNNKNLFHCFPLEKEDDGRQFSPSSQRNSPHILKVLKKHLPASGTVLEIAAGTGEHAVMFAPKFPKLTWLPSDPAGDKRKSIFAWMKVWPSENILPPIALDAAAARWPVEDQVITPPITAIICINMIHVSPWQAGLGLLAAAGRILPKGGILYLYGAYKVDGEDTAPSNKDFDETLRKTDPEWGLRELREVEKGANKHGLYLIDVIDMPANNLSVIIEKH